MLVYSLSNTRREATREKVACMHVPKRDLRKQDRKLKRNWRAVYSGTEVVDPKYKATEKKGSLYFGYH